MAYCMPKEDMVFAMTADMQDEPGKIGWVEEQFYTSILPCVQERECVEDPEGEAAFAPEGFAGCPFCPRCRFATEQCARERPTLCGAEGGRLVACHHPL